jgi:hypothetical protein
MSTKGMPSTFSSSTTIPTLASSSTSLTSGGGGGPSTKATGEATIAGAVVGSIFGAAALVVAVVFGWRNERIGRAIHSLLRTVRFQQY